MARYTPRRTVTIEDQGRGIPVDIVSGQAKSALHVLFTAEPGQGGDRAARGLGPSLTGREYGLPAAVVCALSEELVVETTRAGKRYAMSFIRGEPRAEMIELGLTETLGTKITLRPDESVLGEYEFTPAVFAELLAEAGKRHPTIEIVFSSLLDT
jgi:DNA gyrase subunit B